jgi:hypothetical protein
MPSNPKRILPDLGSRHALAMDHGKMRAQSPKKTSSEPFRTGTIEPAIDSPRKLSSARRFAAPKEIRPA